jgi:ribosomal protein S21
MTHSEWPQEAYETPAETEEREAAQAEKEDDQS